MAFTTEFSRLNFGEMVDTCHTMNKIYHDVTQGLRIAIIGAGASGLAVLRVFSLSPIRHEITVFERSNRVGGLWNYDGEGPMYKNLKTNFAKQGMAFPDFPFPEDQEESYVTHRDIKHYLQAYCDSVNGNKCIKFNTTVCSVKPLIGEDANWRITYKSLKNSDAMEESADFDAVFVCNGHFDVPNHPTIPGLNEHFPGKVMHSRDYKIPEPFAGKSVVILGAANSGQDIAADIASVADRVIISHNREPISAKLLPNMSQCAGVVSCDQHGFRLLDGSILPFPDILVCATGYRFQFSFLDSSCGISSDGSGHIKPLYKHFVNAHNPTMFLIGVCQNVAPFPMFYMQSQASLAILEKRFSLPAHDEMMAAIEKDYEHKMRLYHRPKYAHLMADEQWAYNDELAHIAGCTPLRPFVHDVFYKCAYMRQYHLTYYRDYKFTVQGDRVFMKPINGAPEIDEEDLLSLKPNPLPGTAAKEEHILESSSADTSTNTSYSSGPSSMDGSSSGNASSDESDSSEYEDIHLQCYRKRVLSSADDQLTLTTQLVRA